MKRALRISITFKAALLFLGFASCCRQPVEIWDDTKTCSRHFSRGLRALVGMHTSSRQVQSKDEFICWEEPVAYEDNCVENDYIAFPEERNSNQIALADFSVPQPRVSPGDFNSSIPSIDAFRDPTLIPDLKNIFRNVQFEYNREAIKGQSNLETIQAVSRYLQNHPNSYIFVEGNCDERGAEAYNLALGARRSNSVRNALVQAGANPEHIFTISYGAERPLVLESNEEAWAKNRRVEFKIYYR